MADEDEEDEDRPWVINDWCFVSSRGQNRFRIFTLRDGQAVVAGGAGEHFQISLSRLSRTLNIAGAILHANGRVTRGKGRGRESSLFEAIVAMPDDEAEELIEALLGEFCKYCYTRGADCNCMRDD